MGIWEHRGKVAAVGLAYSPTSRRWDEKVQTSMASLSILAVKKALEDAGITADQVDGVVTSPGGLGEAWARRPVPEDFAKTYKMTEGNNEDGITQMSADFRVRNMPELRNVQFTMHGPGCHSNALCVASEAVGRGMAHTVIVLTARGNLAGRYGQAGQNAGEGMGGSNAFSTVWGPTGPFQYAWLFNKYCEKYGGNHDMMANFVITEKENGLKCPEGFFYQNRPDHLTKEDYLNARWIAKPANIYDCDMPIQVAGAFILTTADRAKDMKQKPVYVLNHATTSPNNRGMIQTLEECEASTDPTASKLYLGSGLSPKDPDIENTYEGYTLFHQYYIEALKYAGMKRGDALQFYEHEDISIHRPHPISPSGGNAGNGRTRMWMHSDSILQLQGRAGQR